MPFTGHALDPLTFEPGHESADPLGLHLVYLLGSPHDGRDGFSLASREGGLAAGCTPSRAESATDNMLVSIFLKKKYLWFSEIESFCSRGFSIIQVTWTTLRLRTRIRGSRKITHDKSRILLLVWYYTVRLYMQQIFDSYCGEKDSDCLSILQQGSAKNSRRYLQRKTYKEIHLTRLHFFAIFIKCSNVYQVLRILKAHHSNTIREMYKLIHILNTVCIHPPVSSIH